ncbi:MAG: single-stranded DNA-binding protein [Candidatus Dojkabacteria bacterium]
MFGDVNKITLMGNVTKDPDLRFTPSGAPVVSFSVATNRRYKKGEEWLEEAAFHNIVVWNQAEQLSQRIRKGTRIYIEGRVQTRSWDGADGKKQYKTEVVAEKVILISRFEGSNDSEGSGASSYSKSSSPKSAPAEAEESGAEEEIDPSDLPF